MTWKVTGNLLLVDGVDVAELPYPVLDAAEVSGTVVLVLDVPTQVAFSDNVFGYVLAESRLWQIEPNGYYDVPAERQIRVTGISPMRLPGQIALFTWLGILVFVDPSTGRVLSTRVGK